MGQSEQQCGSVIDGQGQFAGERGKLQTEFIQFYNTYVGG